MNGLRLTLKKRYVPTNTPPIPLNGTDYKLYTVLGHYDALEIKEINGLDEFAPPNEENLSPENVEFSRFHIRLVSPDMDLSEIGECFSLPLLSDNYSKPLLSIISLNLTEFQMGDITPEENLKNIAEYVSTICKENAEIMKNTSFSIFYSLGSADFIVLCQSDSYSPAFEVLYRLRNENNLLSDSHMIPCMLHGTKENVNALKLIRRNDDTQLSIRAHFRNGGQIDNFISDFKEVAENMGIDPEKELVFHRISGNSDLLVLAGKDFCKYAELYQDGKFLFTCDKKYGVAVRTSVRIKIECPISGVTTISTGDDVLENQTPIPQCNTPIQESKTLEKLKKCLKFHTEDYHNNSTRLLDGYVKMYKHYENSTKQNYITRFMIGGVFSRLIRVLEHDRKLRIKFKASNRAETEGHENAEQTDISLNELRDSLTKVLNDLSRSSRQGTEEKMLGHQVMGTSQKLIFAYSSIVQKIAKFFAEKKDSDGDCYHIVTSGGTDEVTAIFFFNHHNIKDTHIIELTLPERSLYDTSSLFDILHEQFHHTGIRCRPLRKKCFINSLIAQYATEFTDLLLKSKTSGLKIKRNFNGKKIRKKTIANIISVMKHFFKMKGIPEELNFDTSIDVRGNILKQIDGLFDPNHGVVNSKARNLVYLDSDILKVYAVVIGLIKQCSSNEVNNDFPKWIVRNKDIVKIKKC